MVTNCPTEPLRWSLKSACREFEINRQTLQRRMTEARISAGKDGLYSTHDILAAVAGDLRAQKLKKVTEEAINMALRNQERRHELLPKDEVHRCLSASFYTMRQTILGFGLDEHLQNSLL